MTTTDARDETVHLDGNAVRYRIAGQGPLLILHPPGWGIGAAPYVATLSWLEDLFTVVYVWPRGSAGTPVLRPEAQLDVDAFVADLERLRVHLDTSEFAIAGHSHSGLIALHYALQHPDRVSRLLLMSPQLTGLPSPVGEPPPADGPVPAEVAEAMRYLASVGGFEAMLRVASDAEATEFLGRILPLYFEDPSNMTDLVTALAGVTLPYRTLQAVTTSDEQHALRLEPLTRLEIPTTVVAGRKDRVCPIGQAETLVHAMPDATLLAFERSGHFPWLEEPVAFVDRVGGALSSAWPRRAHQRPVTPAR